METLILNPNGGETPESEPGGDSSVSDRLVAHRGYAALYPENTLESLTAALETGIRYVEFDVHLTADGVPVMLHDSDLQRTAGKPGCVHDLNYAALADYDVSERERLGERFHDVRVATLRETVETLQRFPDRRAFVEIKRASLRRFGRTKVLQAVLAACAPAWEQCILISFDIEVLRRARRMIAAPRLAWVASHYNRADRSALASLQPDFVFCNHEKIGRDEELWPGVWRWVLYDIGDPALAAEWFARGVDLIETMAVGELLDSPLIAAAIAKQHKETQA